MISAAPVVLAATEAEIEAVLNACVAGWNRARGLRLVSLATPD
jgi:hypothetical protein